MQVNKSNSPKIVIASPGNGVFIIQSALAYYEKGLLFKYYTSYVSNINTPFYSLIKNTKLGKELNRRAVYQIPSNLISTYPIREIIRTITSKLFHEIILDKVFDWAERSFDKWVSKKITKEVSILHCYEHTSLEMMRKAKEIGTFIVYEQPSQHHTFLTPIIKNQIDADKNLLDDVSELLVNNIADIRNHLRDIELSLADLIICNSSFTKQTLINAGIDNEKIKVVPLGFPNVKDLNRNKTKTKLRFIYAGTSNIRKGVHLLIYAWNEIFQYEENAELYIVGKFGLPEYFKSIASSNIKFIDSMPREELMLNFLDSDILILPTLADGFGMVISEAMSRGLCVIATQNSAAPDLIQDKKNGLIIDSASIESLKDALIWCLKNRNTLSTIGYEAMKSASLYQWKEYRDSLFSTVIRAYDQKK